MAGSDAYKRRAGRLAGQQPGSPRWLVVLAFVAFVLHAGESSALSTIFRLDPETNLARGGSGIAIGGQVAMFSPGSYEVDITMGPVPDVVLLEFRGVTLPSVHLGLYERLDFALLDAAGNRTDSFMVMARLDESRENWIVNPGMLPVHLGVTGIAGRDAIHWEAFDLALTSTSVARRACSNSGSMTGSPVAIGTGSTTLLSSLCLTAFDLYQPLVLKLEGSFDEDVFPFPAHMPEPGTGVMVALGLAGLAYRRRMLRLSLASSVF